MITLRKSFLKLIIVLSFMFVSSSYSEKGFGFIAMDSTEYRMLNKSLTYNRALPSSYDARTSGIVSSAKDQGTCGSCWAFASVGALESHIKKTFPNEALLDLSEQQQVACNVRENGCDGGSLNAPTFWVDRGPVLETVYGYDTTNLTCSYDRDMELKYRVKNFHTVLQSPSQFKISLLLNGPSIFAYRVYNDFQSFWNSTNPGAVYNHNNSQYSGYEHGVLLIGWDDSKNAFLCKNSWGASGGPNGDGTFWTSYYNLQLNYRMCNFEVDTVPYNSHVVIDDFDVNRTWWNLYSDMELGWKIIKEGSSTTSTQIDTTSQNSLDPFSINTLEWNSYIGRKHPTSIDHHTGERVENPYHFTGVGTAVNLRDCEGIIFDAKCDVATSMDVHLSPKEYQLYIAKVNLSPGWNRFTIPFSAFTASDYWIPDDPQVIPENQEGMSFELSGINESEYGKSYNVVLDNIKAYSSKLITRQVSTTSGANGKIIPQLATLRQASETIDIPTGGMITLDFVPDSGYKVFDVIIDNYHLGPVTSHTIENMQDDHTIEALFIEENIDIWTVTTADSMNGIVNPLGKVSVRHEGHQTFTFTPYQHQKVKDVIVDSVPLGEMNSYTFTNVTTHHFLAVEFEDISWTIALSCDSNTIIEPTGKYIAIDSTNLLVSIEAKQYYSVKDIIVDNISQGPSHEHLFTIINEDHSLHAISNPNLVIDDFEDSDLLTNSGEPLWPSGDCHVVSPNISGNSVAEIANIESPDDSLEQILSFLFKLGNIPAKDSTGADIGQWTGVGLNIQNFDLNEFDGIIFKAKASRVFNNAFSVGCNMTQYYTAFNITTEWQEYKIAFSDLVLSPWATPPHTEFSTVAIVNLNWSLYDGGLVGEEIVLYLDDIQAYTDSTAWQINAEAENGNIYPQGNTAVLNNGSQTYTMITPDNHILTDVLVNGVSVGTDTSYTFTYVTENQTIKAVFENATCSLNVSVEGVGMISPANDTVLNNGESISYEFIAGTGYHIKDILIDNESKGPIETFIFNDVKENHTIHVIFAIDTFLLEYGTDINGTIIGDSVQVVEYNKSGSCVEAVPNVNYEFVGWSDGSLENPRIDNNVTDDINVIAFFDESVEIIHIGKEKNKSDILGIKVAPNPVSAEKGCVQIFVNSGIQKATVKISILDNIGDIIDMQNSFVKIKGAHKFIWNLKNQKGINVSSGIYKIIATVKYDNGEFVEYESTVGIER